jgi:hypothetical protein
MTTGSFTFESYLVRGEDEREIDVIVEAYWNPEEGDGWNEPCIPGHMEIEGVRVKGTKDYLELNELEQENLEIKAWGLQQAAAAAVKAATEERVYEEWKLRRKGEL